LSAESSHTFSKLKEGKPMKMMKVACFVVLVFLGALATTALAATHQGYMWNGTHWKTMNTDIKVAYVKGIGNMADFENAAGGTGTAACIAKGFVDELKTKSIAQVISQVDKFYKENPDKAKTPVIEVILQRCTKLCKTSTAEKQK
jgi:hypothetical protein